MIPLFDDKKYFCDHRKDEPTMVNFENLDKHLKKLIDEKAFPAATIAV